MDPAFSTVPLLSPANTRRSARKSSLRIDRLDATSAPTFTWAPGAKKIPEGLRRNSCPLEVRLPKMLDAELPVTRFSAMEEADGCWNRTDSPAAMLNERQSRIARWVVWLIRRLCPLGWVAVTWPAATLSSVGSARTSGDTMAIRHASRRAMRRAGSTR